MSETRLTEERIDPRQAGSCRKGDRAVTRLTTRGFRAWLRRQPPEAVVGTIGNCRDCPTARYLRSLGIRDAYVDEIAFLDAWPNATWERRLPLRLRLLEEDLSANVGYATGHPVRAEYCLRRLDACVRWARRNL